MAFNFMQTISFIYLSLLLFTRSASSISHHQECLALFQFKQTVVHQDYASFDAGRFQKLDSWKNITSNASDYGSDCCLWGGVVCNNEGHVIELDLSKSNLYGPIKSNSTLFDLVHLEMLNLSMNDFVESQIPSEIAHLQELRILNLSNSRFSGQIPKEISYLVQLSSLDLSLNPLKLQSPSLEYLLQNLTGLEELCLSRINISSSVPRFMANLSSLTSIKLGYCCLQDEFPTAIFHLPKLRYLYLKDNPHLFGWLPEFHNTTLLEHLNLFSTGFAGFIPESISKLNHLVYLKLSNCSFSGRIPGSLSNLTQLTSLFLGNNMFTGPVPPLESLTKLSIVAMGRNLISGHIPSLFMNLTTLTVVDVGDNQLQGQISNVFSTLKSLKYLDLGWNNFSGTVDLDTFRGLNKLEKLYLDRNNISCVYTNNFTNDFLQEMKSLNLASCNLKEFPPFLRFQKKMNHLFLGDNKIEGLIPEWVWNNSQETLQLISLPYNFITGLDKHPHFLPWSRLEYIDISNNHLQGKLPVPPLTTIFYDVSNNNLIGEIPPLICKIKSLRYLDLSSNNMIGTLPPCLGALSSSLSVLDLKRNNFHGPMMSTFTHGSRVKWIDLSENQFTGQLSKSLANCTNLEVLALGDNCFDGILPFWLGNLIELQVLILRSNKFNGSIQGFTSISSQFLKLRIVDLSNNEFSGQLPDESFRNWNSMKSRYIGNSSVMGFMFSFDILLPHVYPFSMTLTNKGVKTEYQKILNIFIAIDLSRNNFEGEIPRSLQDLQGIQSLNLSNNHLTGRILPSLGNLKNLESLDLSQNELSGEIPQQLLQLGFLEIFNVSFNHLEGHIPQGKQFDTFDNNSYKGNLGLCGQPLSKDCQSLKASTLPKSSNEYECLLPSERIDWIIIFLGVGNGLVIGIIFGNILFAECSFWFIERFGMRKDRWVRPLSNMRRNHVLS